MIVAIRKDVEEDDLENMVQLAKEGPILYMAIPEGYGKWSFGVRKSQSDAFDRRLRQWDSELARKYSVEVVEVI